MLRQGDIFLVRANTWLGGLIRKVLDEPNDPAQVNHVGIVLKPTKLQALYLRKNGVEVYREMAIEALWTIKAHSFKEVLDSYDEVWIARHKHMSKEALDILTSYAVQFVGVPYSIRRFVYQGFHKLFGWKWAKQLPLDELDCSAFVAMLYFPFGLLFEGKSPKLVTPDDIWDTVERRPNWELFKIKGPIETDCEE